MQYIQRIIEERKRKGLTQNQIAEYLNTTQQQINKYERGVQEIPVRRLIQLANLYKVSLDYLTGRTDEREINIKPTKQPDFDTKKN